MFICKYKDGKYHKLAGKKFMCKTVQELAHVELDYETDGKQTRDWFKNNEMEVIDVDKAYAVKCNLGVYYKHGVDVACYPGPMEARYLQNADYFYTQEGAQQLLDMLRKENRYPEIINHWIEEVTPEQIYKQDLFKRFVYNKDVYDKLKEAMDKESKIERGE